MPGPTTVPQTWATDTNFDSTGNAWDATANKAAPAASLSAEGWEPETAPDPRTFNYLFNLIGQWLTYFSQWVDEANDEIVYPVAKSRTIVLPLTGAASSESSITPGQPAWFHDAFWLCEEVTQSLELSLTLPDEATLTQISVEVRPGGNLGNMSAALFSNEVGGFQTTEIAAVSDDGTAAVQNIVLSGSVTISRATKSYRIRITSRSGTFSQPDQVRTITATFNDPGPRNF